MSTPLLTTKLHIPPMRPKLVSRPRLIERLNEGPRSGRKLTLISAPAGFGKTTLLCEWAASCEPWVRVAWLSLDYEDNDVACFWTYLIAAPQTAYPGLGQDALKLLQASQPLPAQAIVTPLLNEIADLSQTSSTNGVVLVLDDYHLIFTRAIHEGIAFLLEHQPHKMHLAISTRADPPLPAFRLRARGQLTELRSDDLRFTPEEATIFLNTLMGLNLTTEDVKALEAHTEGWIVGLQLAALSMQGRDAEATHEFIAAFTGGHHYILEYLTEEVVRRQPEPVRRFLMETSILNRPCGPLRDALRRPGVSPAERDGAAMLTYLQRCNLFIVPLDDERSWMAGFQGERFASALNAANELKAWAEGKGHSLVDLAIAWVLANPAVTLAIVGAKTPEQAVQNTEAANWFLTPEDLQEIDQIQGDYRILNLHR